MFAATYSLRGPIDSPKVGVNPLAALTARVRCAGCSACSGEGPDRLDFDTLERPGQAFQPSHSGVSQQPGCTGATRYGGNQTAS